MVAWGAGLQRAGTAEPDVRCDPVANPRADVNRMAAGKTVASLDTDILQILKWLPDDTESILVSSAALPRDIVSVEVVTPDGKGGRHSVSDGSYLSYDFAEAVADISVSPLLCETGFMPDELRQQIKARYFTPTDVRLYMMAARNRNGSSFSKCDQLTVIRFRREVAKDLVAQIEPLAATVIHHS